MNKIQRKIELDGQQISYCIKISKRARYISLSAYFDGRLVVSLPENKTEESVIKFLFEKKKWILKNVSERILQNIVLVPNHRGKKYLLFKKHARSFINKRVIYFNEYYQLKYKKIYIKNQKSQWGSCSSKKNLNFNYKLIFLPEELANYVIVHELCHLKELNHSKSFWALVEESIPNYQQLEQKLRRYHIA